MKMQLTKQEIQVIKALIISANGHIEKDFLPATLNSKKAYHVCQRLLERIMVITNPKEPEP